MSLQVFLTSARTPVHGPIAGRKWCLLWATPEYTEDLHTMAARLGLHRNWFQNEPGFPYYFLSADHRAFALLEGCLERESEDRHKRT